MSDFAKPRVLISRCLGFAACRWNGQVISDDFVERLKPALHCQPVCPEVEIGLGVPRDPVRLVESKGAVKLLQPASGLDASAEMDRFARSHLESLQEVDGFILKSRSPSCGPVDVKIYSGPQPGASSRRGAGLFGGAVLRCFPLSPVEHEGRLKNFLIREHFLTQLYTLAEFRRVQSTEGMGKLVAFHARHKLLLMAYNQHRLRLLGRIVANHSKKKTLVVFQEYGVQLALALKRRARRGPVINVLLHALGYFKRELSSAEKKHFMAKLEDYRQGLAPLSLCQVLLGSWIARFDNQYLAGQSFFEPYPASLLTLSDSGKGRDL